MDGNERTGGLWNLQDLLQTPGTGEHAAAVPAPDAGSRDLGSGQARPGAAGPQPERPARPDQAAVAPPVAAPFGAKPAPALANPRAAAPPGLRDPAAPWWSRHRAGVLIGVLLLLTGGAGGAVALNGDVAARPTTGAPAPTAGAAGDAAATSVAPATPSVPEESTSTTAPATETATETATTTDSEQQAGLALEGYRQTDLARLLLDGRWVAQLASKEAGITDPVTGQTYDLAGILAQHEALRQRDDLGDVFLLQTTDYGTDYAGPVLWVTFADPGAGSAREVREWCASRFPDLTGAAQVNACAPRRLRNR